MPRRAVQNVNKHGEHRCVFVRRSSLVAFDGTGPPLLYPCRSGHTNELQDKEVDRAAFIRIGVRNRLIAVYPMESGW